MHINIAWLRENLFVAEDDWLLACCVVWQILTGVQRRLLPSSG
jgi:hypothetical protein